MSVFIGLPAFPDVPFVPGVPAVARAIGIAQVVGDFLTGDGLGITSLAATQPWGIYDSNGNPAIVGDAIVSVEFHREYNVPAYPIENGGYASYNKVETPYEVRMTFTCGSGVPTGVFLSSVDAAITSINLYTVVTPEVSYPSVSVDHYDYKRTAQNGANMMTVEIVTHEVRVQAGMQTASTVSPSGASPISGGTVQATAPTDQQSSAIQQDGGFS